MNQGRVLIFSMLLAGILLCPLWTGSGHAFDGQAAAPAGPQGAGDAAADGEAAGYHTPLAGEPFQTVFMGRKVDVPARDRGRVTSLTLGGTYYTPKEGNTRGAPIFAFYLKRMWEESRTRDVISIFVNDLEYDRSMAGALEFVGRFENYTVPGGQKETLDNRDIKETSVEWGTLAASLGPGLRYMVAPFQVDNDLRLQLLGRVGYFYVSRTKETGSDQILPHDTMLYGAKLRGRYDGMWRNILDLPHTGLAAGFDLDYTHRDKWKDFGDRGGEIFTKADTRDYLQFSGYITGAGGVPWTSEKNRVLFSVHGGTTSRNSADRYNAFRIGGGPIPGESDDLARPDYPGTMFNEVLAKNYALASIEYRRELTFFMYLHLRGSFIWADRSSLLDRDELVFRSKCGAAGTVGLDSGFIWDSEVYLAYSYESGFIRNGKPGSGIIFLWNKKL